MRRWQVEAGITAGPLLRAVNRHGQAGPALSDRAVALIVKKHMRALGYPIEDFAGHSLRRGLATERTIMRTTGHTSTTTVRGYIEDAELFTNPASKYLGL